MARALPGTASNYLTHTDNASVRLALPLTIGFWWNGATHTAFTYMLSKLLTAGDHPSYGFSFNTGGELRFLIGWGTNPSEVTVTSTTAGSGNVYNGSWHHVCGTYDGTTMTCYVDGVSMGTASENRTVQYGASNLYLGSFDGLTLGAAGSIAELAMWSDSLTADDVVSLSKAVSPSLVRPGKLLNYWKIIGVSSPEPEVVRTMDLTITGTVAAAAHTRMYYRATAFGSKLTTAAAAATNFGRQFMPFF